MCWVVLHGLCGLRLWRSSYELTRLLHWQHDSATTLHKSLNRFRAYFNSIGTMPLLAHDQSNINALHGPNLSNEAAATLRDINIRAYNPYTL